MSFCYLSTSYRVREVPGHPGFLADSMGVIWRRIRGRLVVARTTIHRYAATNAGGKTVRIHRLVLLAFYGEPPDGMNVGRHLNDVKTDNRPENLAWGTDADNMHDKMKSLGRHWRAGSGSRQWNGDIQEIVELIKGWRTAYEISDLTGISLRNVYQIFHREFPKGSHPWDDFKIRDAMRAKLGLPKIKRGAKHRETV